MAENVLTRDEEYLRNVKALLWGNTIKEDVFKRWAQGFYFSQEEPTALVQTEGGPCAVIAPVQAFILRDLLLERDISKWKSVDHEICDQLLLQACMQIISQASGNRSPKFSMVCTDNAQDVEASTKANAMYQETDESKDRLSESKEETEKTKQLNKECGESRIVGLEEIVDFDVFHSRLRIFGTNSIEQAERFLKDRLDMLKGRYGILLLLYTVVFTKGVPEIRTEMSDPLESMIDSTYGYGSQSLINLMLTGRAVSHVWDHDQNIGGLNLRGIDKQNSIGFLALLEHLRYCEVGSFLKSPSHPVWVLGSETHLTVLFSNERRLVSPETPAEHAKRVFRKFDPEGNNFIPANLLQDVLVDLGLVADTEYVDIMTKKLDSENLGIILLASFMDEFFPEEPATCPDTFPLYHYNGLERSNPDNQVTYIKGQAVLLECNVKCILESNPMLTVLQTKWPRIEIQWELERNPSLN